MFALAFLIVSLPFREEFEYTHLPAQHLLFIPGLRKQTGDGDAGKWPELWVQTPSNTEEQDETQDRGGWRRPDWDGLRAFNRKIICSASPGKALALPKDHFNSYIPVSFLAILQCRVPKSPSSFTLFPQQLTAIITSITNCPFHVFTFQSLSLPLSQTHVTGVRVGSGEGGRYNRNESDLVI